MSVFIGILRHFYSVAQSKGNLSFDEGSESVLYCVIQSGQKGAKRANMSLSFTYWQEQDGMWLGYMNDYPDYMTEGRTFEDLKRMLLSLRSDIEAMQRSGKK